MPLPERGDDPRAALKSRLYDLNRDAARWFYSQLATPAGAAAADYMARRQISPRTAKNFGLGFAPDSWDALTNAMKALGYSERELTEAGLVKRGKRGGVYDAFRNRLMFPVIDQRGSVIAFSGRILGDGEPKYLNSPETPSSARAGASSVLTSQEDEGRVHDTRRGQRRRRLAASGGLRQRGGLAGHEPGRASRRSSSRATRRRSSSATTRTARARRPRSAPSPSSTGWASRCASSPCRARRTRTSS